MAILALAAVVAKIAGPIIVSSIAAKVGARVRPEETQQITAEVTQQIVNQIATDPVVKNELNAEAPIQSRVAWGAVIAALGVLVPIAGNLFGWDVDEARVVEIGGAVVTLCGAAYVLYGRFKSGLAPLFSRR